MKPTPISLIKRPAQMLRTKKHNPVPKFHLMGRRRYPLSTKDGKKDYYKGTGSSGIGRHTKYGGYIIDWSKVKTFVVPEEFQYSDLKTFVSSTSPDFKNSFSGFQNGPMNGNWYLKSLDDYIKYGEVETNVDEVEETGYESL